VSYWYECDYGCDVKRLLPTVQLFLKTTRETAGLTLDVNVAKIDDNGFVSYKVNPEISVSVPRPTRDVQQGVQIFNITK